jgi:hypothetical protein
MRKRIIRAMGLIAAMSVCVMLATASVPSNQVGVPISDADASAIRGGACSGWDTIYCEIPCAGSCYSGGSGILGPNPNDIGTCCGVIYCNTLKDCTLH